MFHRNAPTTYFVLATFCRKIYAIDSYRGPHCHWKRTFVYFSGILLIQQKVQRCRRSMNLLFLVDIASFGCFMKLAPWFSECNFIKFFLKQYYERLSLNISNFSVALEPIHKIPRLIEFSVISSQNLSLQFIWMLKSYLFCTLYHETSVLSFQIVDIFVNSIDSNASLQFSTNLNLISFLRPIQQIRGSFPLALLNLVETKLAPTQFFWKRP